MMAMLTVNNLDFEVRDKKILNGLDLALTEGDIYALLGANGTGKTTLAYLIMGCAGYTPSSGEIHFQQ